MKQLTLWIRKSSGESFCVRIKFANYTDIGEWLFWLSGWLYETGAHVVKDSLQVVTV